MSSIPCVVVIVITFIKTGTGLGAIVNLRANHLASLTKRVALISK
jgi:hypothetical protein